MAALSSRLTHSLWFRCLALLAICNVSLYIYLAVAEEDVLDMPSADRQIDEQLSDKAKFIAPVRDLLELSYLYTNTDRPEFTEAFSSFRQQLESLGVRTEPLFQPKRLKNYQGGIYWEPPLDEQKISPSEAVSR